MGEPPSPDDMRDFALSQLVHERLRRRALEDPENIHRAIEWLSQKWGSRPCPYCGDFAWQVGTPLEIRLADDELMSPAFPVMCGNCGNTVLINAVVAGLVPPEK